MADDVLQSATRPRTQRVIGPVTVGTPGYGGHHHLDDRQEPCRAHSDQGRAEPPPALRQHDKDPDRGKRQGDILPGEKSQGHHRPQQAVVLHQHGVETKRDRGDGEGDVMKVVDHRR